MGIGIALIAGFVLGCGCTVALLFCLKPAAEAVGLLPATPKPPKPEQAPAEPENTDKPPPEQQWQNLFGYDGKPQKGGNVKENET